MSNYQIPLGIDAEGTINPLNRVIDTIERTGQVADQASREISTGFTNGGRAANELERRISPIVGGLNEVTAVSRTVQQGITNAFNERNVNTNSILNKVNDFKAKLQAIDITKRIGLEVEQGAVQELELALRQMQEGFPSIQAELAQQVSYFDNAVRQSRENIAQLTADISRMEGELAGQAPSQARSTNEADLGSARQALAEEQVLLQENTSSLSQYQNASRELVGNLQNANRAVNELRQDQIGLNSTFEQVYGEVQPLTTRLGELEDRMYELALAGQRDTNEFRELRDEAIRMRQTIQEVDAAVDTMSKRSGRIEAYVSVANGIVGAFTAAQGAVALFAGENEEMNEVLTRVMAAMALLQGVQATLEIFNKENAASILFTSTARTNEAQSTVIQTNATNAHTIALNAETAAQIAATAAASADTVAANAATAADTAAAAAAASDTAATTAQTAATIAQTSANAAQTEVSVTNTTATVAETAATNALATAEGAAATGAASNTVAQGAQTIAMTASSVAATALGFALKAIGIGLIITAVAALVEYWDELKDAFNKILPAGQSVSKMFDTLKSYAFGVGEAIIKAIITPVNAINKLISGDIKGAIEVVKNGLNVVDNFQTGFNRQQLRNQEKYLNEKEAKEIEMSKRDLERRKNRGEDVYAQEQKLFQREIALKKKMRDDTDEIEKAMEDAQDKRYAENQRKAEAARKKAEADAKAAAQKRKQEQEKALAEEKRNLELMLKYGNEIRKLAIYNDGEENDPDIDRKYLIERAALWADYQNRLEDLQRDDPTTPEAIEKQNQLRFYIELGYKNQLKDMEIRQNREMAAIKLDGLKLMNSLNKEGRDNDLKSAELEAEGSIASIRERYENDYILAEYLVEKTRKQLEEKRKEINLRYDQKQIDENLEKASILLELNKKSNNLSEKQEAQHQLAILNLQEQAAQAQVDLLLSSGKTEEDLEVLQARLKVKKIKDAIKDESKKGGQFDIWEYLGLTKGMTGEDREKVVSAATDILKNLSDIADGVVDQYQRQIDKKQEVIDQYTNEIDDLEGRLEKEKELRDEGLANNVETLEAEIAAKKAQRDEEIRQQEELQRKQAAIQKAQLIADTAFQLAGLITSSVNIIKGFSTIPIIGLPLGIAAVATMFGAFALAKTKAFQAVGQTNKMEKGGWIDGALHIHGGTKYYNKDGNVTELEQGEFVVNRKVAAEWAPLLEAMNAGKLDTMGLFEAMGVSFDTPTIYESAKEGASIKEINNTYHSQSYDFSNIDNNISYLAKSKKEEIQYSEDSQYYYKTQGTRTTRIRKS